MNFIDKYKKDLEEQTSEADESLVLELTDEQKEMLKNISKDTMLGAISTLEKEKEKEAMNVAMMNIANAYCDCAEIFFERLKGKLTYNKIVPLLLSFYDMVARTQK